MITQYPSYRYVIMLIILHYVMKYHAIHDNYPIPSPPKKIGKKEIKTHKGTAGRAPLKVC